MFLIRFDFSLDAGGRLLLLLLSATITTTTTTIIAHRYTQRNDKIKERPEYNREQDKIQDYYYYKIQEKSMKTRRGKINICIKGKTREKNNLNYKQ